MKVGGKENQSLCALYVAVGYLVLLQLKVLGFYLY